MKKKHPACVFVKHALIDAFRVDCKAIPIYKLVGADRYQLHIILFFPDILYIVTFATCNNDASY